MESSRLSDFGVFQTVLEDGVVKRKELDSLGVMAPAQVLFCV